MSAYSVWFVALGQLVTAAEAGMPDVQRAKQAAPAPIQDDAGLNHVQLLGSKLGWAVGDHGVIWQTRDGGQNWALLQSPVKCSLRKACFLTDRVGWVVGGAITPFTRIGYGVVLFTQDGGETWQQLAADQLPQLHDVEFFSMQDGIAVGEASANHSTGVFVTSDGGKTWQDVIGKRTDGWRTADFLSPDEGVVAGLRGHVALVGGKRLLSTRSGDLGIRGLHDVVLGQDQAGWLVGDGSLVLHTGSGGVVWQSPPTELPNDLRDMVDFHAVACRGQSVWIGGDPGSVVWHSPDGGHTWQKQLTSQPQPIHSLHFPSDSIGCAVGALGTILRTGDGGRTWQAVRGAGRRVAFLTIHARPDQVSLALLTKYSAELGYRSTVSVVPRRDLGPEGDAEQDLDLRLQDAVTAAGGSSAELGWRLPVAAPGLDRNAEKLVADWDLRTEGRLREVVLGELVSQLRTWRPSIVVLDQPEPHDAITRLLNEAVLNAVGQAADPTRFVKQYELAGLKPWQVSKVFQRLPEGSTGQVHVDAHELLPRLGTTTANAAAPAYGKLTPVSRQPAFREAYRLIFDPTASDIQLAASSDFWAGIGLAPGSAARRRLLPIDEAEYERQLKIAKRQRNFRAYTDRFLDDDRHAGQLIAQLRQVVSGMSDDQAALQLRQLANSYRHRSQWDLAEATVLELADHYPDEPAALDAMRWLFQWSASAEVAWQRSRHTGVGIEVARTDRQAAVSQFREQLRYAQNSRDGRPSDSQLSKPIPTIRQRVNSRLQTSASAQSQEASVKNWQERAFLMAKLVAEKTPTLHNSPEIQFPLAALLRQRGSNRLADEIYRRHQTAGDGDPWKDAALTELWLVQPVNTPRKPVAICRPTSDRPHLDGVLSDMCWQDAVELPLTDSGSKDASSDALSTQPALAMLSHDSEYLYFAASIPRVPGTPGDGPQYEGRSHDADLSDFDRVSLYIDIDRDYTTYYAIHVDQRGWTAESCWEDSQWDPRLHVAADAGTSYWRIEVAIPLEELTPPSLAHTTIWAVGVVRTVPTVGVQSWSHPTGTRPGPGSFGLVRFR